MKRSPVAFLSLGLAALAVLSSAGCGGSCDMESLRRFEEAGEAFDPIKEVETYERGAALREQLKTLDETCRTAIQFFYVQALSYKEISARLGIAVNTVGSRLAKCLEKLRGMVEKDPFLREYR